MLRTMRGEDKKQSSMLVLMSPESRVPQTHPLRVIKKLADEALRLARKGKGKEAKLSYSAHALIENRNGLVLDLQMDVADGHAERRNALEMLDKAHLQIHAAHRRASPHLKALAPERSAAS